MDYFKIDYDVMESPSNIAHKWLEIGKKKINMDCYRTLILGIMAGIFIALGGHGSLVVSQSYGKFMGAAVFPVGIILVVLAGGELFTGNTLIAVAFLNREISFKNVLKNLSLVYVANFIGAFLTAFLLYHSGLYNGNLGEKAILVAEGKISIAFSGAIIRGIFCNILVVLAVWISSGAKDGAGKILALWFPVMLFVISGFEHSIANMYFLPLGWFLGLKESVTKIIWFNIIPVTIGNIIGGMLVVSAAYWYVYLSKVKSLSK